ncbi:NUDIX hydrolase [Kitasatospora kifunensis]|uniref:8-oxo-dGTP pyrophosphatase MutT (NUDIX family) n=1 Tax=Kitasatospora kifunensis TaxID=58351 RepID=A0A7W7RA12_KITKI|nr:NUDIX domain-containing protein [Kitasatospora kifunensis]MBB4927521.1 8-oxo-dGTP pyrophosphatase MutT (NUDIX family) [Kitasatospora kifunensis]
MAETIEKVAWIHLDAGRLLATRTHGRDLFYLPGGKPESGETHEQALVREIGEELGITLDATAITPVLIVQAPADNKPAGTVVRTYCFTADHAGEPAACGEIAEIAYLTHGDHPRASPATREVLDRLAASGGLLRW